MFRILSFKNIAFFCAAVTLIAVACLIIGTAKPSVPVFGQSSVQLPVIMYHQISDNKNLFGDYVIPPALLEEDFKYIKENGFTPVGIDRLEAFVKNGTPLPEKSILITFDDGQRSFLTKVVPLLEKYNYPAVISIIGSLTESYTQSGDTDDRYAYLNRNDIIALSKNPLVEIGNHSYNMHSLSVRRGMGRLPGEPENEYRSAAAADMRKLQALLFEITETKPRVLTYPYGEENEILLDEAKKEGFTVTLTCRECVNTLTPGGDLYELGRFNRPYGISSEVFFERISR